MPRPPSRTRQLLDPMAAFQMVHIMEGVIQRGTATVLRDLNRPLFGKTGTTTGPTNVWFVGGTPDIVAGVYLGYDQPRPLGGYAQGGRIAAPIFKQWAQTALKDQPKVPFVAPPGSAGSASTAPPASRVFGVFPTTEDPQVGGDLGSVPAADRAAAHATAARCGDPYNAGRSSSRRPAAAAGGSATAAAHSGSGRHRPRAAAPAPPSSQPRPACQRRTRSNSGCSPSRRSRSSTMRAEAQAHIDQINAATALLRRFLDWDRALTAARGAERQGRGSDAVGRPQGGAGGDARAAPARRGDRRDARRSSASSPTPPS